MITGHTLLRCGHCTHPEFTVIQGGQFGAVVFPSTVLVLEHREHGIILFDVGYAPHVLQAMRPFPEVIYKWLTPVFTAPATTAVAQLGALGIKAADVRYVVLSHFHADHIGGLLDFPGATLLYRDAAYAAVSSLGRVRALRQGFLPKLLPQDFAARSRPVVAAAAQGGLTPLQQFPLGYDLFGDGSVVGVDLPGHVHGQMGVFFESQGRQIFATADAAWFKRNITELRLPNPLARAAIADFPAYRDTIHRLHAVQVDHPDLFMAPCHCSVSAAAYPGTLPARGGPH